MAALYDRYVLPALITAACGSKGIMFERSTLIPRACGRVLEIGAGGGLNLRYYDPQKVSLVEAVDPSAALLARAARAPRPLGLQVNFSSGVAEHLAFEDGAFETVVFTFTLCSVASPALALGEARRVLRPGGQVLFCEHGLSPDPSVALWQRRLDPLWGRLAGGCRLTRALAPSLSAAGFILGEGRGGYLRGAPKFAGWCERGAARKAP